MFAELHRKTRQLEMLNSELRRLSGALIATQDEERRRIARELHDGLGQELTAAKIMLRGVSQEKSEAARKEVVSGVSAIIDRTLQQVRSISYLLHPPLLDEVGLQSALHWYFEGLTKRSGIETSLEVQPEHFPGSRPSWRPRFSASFRKR